MTVVVLEMQAPMPRRLARPCRLRVPSCHRLRGRAATASARTCRPDRDASAGVRLRATRRFYRRIPKPIQRVHFWRTKQALYARLLH